MASTMATQSKSQAQSEHPVVLVGAEDTAPKSDGPPAHALTTTTVSELPSDDESEYSREWDSDSSSECDCHECATTVEASHTHPPTREPVIQAPIPISMLAAVFVPSAVSVPAVVVVPYYGTSIRRGSGWTVARSFRAHPYGRPPTPRVFAPYTPAPTPELVEDSEDEGNETDHRDNYEQERTILRDR